MPIVSKFKQVLSKFKPPSSSFSSSPCKYHEKKKIVRWSWGTAESCSFYREVKRRCTVGWNKQRLYSLSSSFSFSSTQSRRCLYVFLRSSCRRRRIRWAGAEDPGRCPGPAGSSSGFRLGPAVRPRGTVSCLRWPNPETEHRAARTRSQRSLCPVSGRRKKKGEKKNHSGSAWQPPTHRKCLLQALFSSDLNWKQKITRCLLCSFKKISQ